MSGRRSRASVASVLAVATSVAGTLTPRLPAQTPAPPSIEQARALVYDLDRGFNTGDPAAYMDRFTGRFPRRHATLRTRLEHLFDLRTHPRRSSEIEEFTARGRVGIAQVRSTYRYAGRDPECVEHSYVAFAAAEPRPQALFEVEIAAGVVSLSRSAEDGFAEFRCPACNYELRVGNRWLLVPTQRARSGCHESLAFYALDDDVEIGVSVSAAPVAAEPVDALRQFVDAFRPDASPDVAIGSWTPPAYAAVGAPEPLRGATCSVPDARLLHVLHLATFGKLHYLIAVSGAPELLELRRAEIERFLHGFRIVDPTIDADRADAQAIAMHTGGRLEGSRYANDRRRVRFAGVGDWPARLLGSEHLFDIAWEQPGGTARLRVQGLSLADCPGGARQRMAVADRIAERAIQDARQLQTTEPGTWRALTGAEVARGGFAHQRTLRGRSGAAGATRYVLRLALDGDLLVALEGTGDDDAALRAIEDALDALARVR